jgi:hypothetical protein
VSDIAPHLKTNKTKMKITNEEIQHMITKTFTVEEITELNKCEPMNPELVKALKNTEAFIKHAKSLSL